MDPYRKIIDVGGGHGGLLRHVIPLNKNTEASYIIAELASVCASAPESAPDLQGKITWVETDFFREVPAGGDLYLLKHILHNWGQEECIAILKNLHRAMDKTARLVCIDAVMPTKPTPGPFVQMSRLPFCTFYPISVSSLGGLFTRLFL